MRNTKISNCKPFLFGSRLNIRFFSLFHEGDELSKLDKNQKMKFVILLKAVKTSVRTAPKRTYFFHARLFSVLELTMFTPC